MAATADAVRRSLLRVLAPSFSYAIAKTCLLFKNSAREERAQAKVVATADAAWRQLLRAALTRVRLENDHAVGRHGTLGGGAARVAHGPGKFELLVPVTSLPLAPFVALA